MIFKTNRDALAFFKKVEYKTNTRILQDIDYTIEHNEGKLFF